MPSALSTFQGLRGSNVTLSRAEFDFRIRDYISGDDGSIKRCFTDGTVAIYSAVICVGFAFIIFGRTIIDPRDYQSLGFLFSDLLSTTQSLT